MRCSLADDRLCSVGLGLGFSSYVGGRTETTEVTCRKEESFCCLFGRARYDADYRLPMAFPDSVVRPLAKSGRYRGQGGPLQHLDTSPNLPWYQHCCCFFFLSPLPPCPSRVLNKALTAGRSPEVMAAASSFGISGMAETVAEGSVTYSASAFCNSPSIDSCGVGSSRVGRNDDGKWRRRAHRSTSSRSYSPPGCRNRAIHCEGFSSATNRS